MRHQCKRRRFTRHPRHIERDRYGLERAFRFHALHAQHFPAALFDRVTAAKHAVVFTHKAVRPGQPAQFGFGEVGLDHDIDADQHIDTGAKRIEFGRARERALLARPLNARHELLRHRRDAILKHGQLFALERAAAVRELNADAHTLVDRIAVQHFPAARRFVVAIAVDIFFQRQFFDFKLDVRAEHRVFHHQLGDEVNPRIERLRREHLISRASCYIRIGAGRGAG